LSLFCHCCSHPRPRSGHACSCEMFNDCLNGSLEGSRRRLRNPRLSYARANARMRTFDRSAGTQPVSVRLLYLTQISRKLRPAFRP
jgi:hypothetical protein